MASYAPIEHMRFRGVGVFDHGMPLFVVHGFAEDRNTRFHGWRY
jgi:hypothetical protein